MKYTSSLGSMQGKEDGLLFKLKLTQQPEVEDTTMRWRQLFSFFFPLRTEAATECNINYLRAVKCCKSLRPPVKIDGQLEGGNVKISHCNCYLSLCRSDAVQPQLSNPPGKKKTKNRRELMILQTAVVLAGLMQHELRRCHLVHRTC